MRFLIGFLIGLTVGAGAVLLTTPLSGQDLQQGARNWLDSLLEEGRKAAAARRIELEARLAELQSSG